MLNTKNVALCVSVALTAWTGGLLFGLAATATVIDISEIINIVSHEKLHYILQLIKRKSRDLQKLLKYFNETTASAYLSYILIRFTCWRLAFVYSLIISRILFICVIILFISIIIPQTSWCHTIIVTVF